MATGTSAGLLDSRGHAQSVFKHEILRQYMPIFVAMLGSYSDGKRVVVLDGFAGRGRYPDGTPASAELILRAMESLRHSRQVSAFFVEKNEKDHQALSAVVDEYVTRGLLAKALPGVVEEHLDTVVTAANGIPLFLFLIPAARTSRLRGLRRFWWVRVAMSGRRLNSCSTSALICHAGPPEP
jgi:hypothetical protein